MTDFARWLAEDGPAALARRDYLMPAEGRDAIVRPPTYAPTERRDSGGFLLDEYEEDGRKRLSAVMDSIGAQANRAEPRFKLPPLDALVPQIAITAGNHVLSLLDLGHRAADAVVRYSSIGGELSEAFREILSTGDARPMARIAPTSLVFGAWDSRASQAKLQRIWRSSIRAWDVTTFASAAQYSPGVPLSDLYIVDGSAAALDAASEIGFRHAPSRGPGGVIVRGGIHRDTFINLTALRAVGPLGPPGDALRSYLLGLALVATAASGPHDLREGCLLVRDPDRPALTEAVHHDGRRVPADLTGDDARTFAGAAAAAFGVGRNRSARFDRDAASAAILERSGGAAPKRRGRTRKAEQDETLAEAGEP